MKPAVNYSRSVFINCPFDEEYQNLFESIVFVVLSCGFIPRCAKDSMDSDEIRINKINNIIKESKYGIHDISRVEMSEKSLLPRFNMPLELGIFLGCQKFGNKNDRQKRYLVLDKDPYRYKQFISDISGQDIQGHNNNPQKIISVIRDWLAHVSKKTIPGSSFHITRFEKFKAELISRCDKYRWDYDHLSLSDYNKLILEFIRDETLEIINTSNLVR
jgi:hypothetical protein